MFFLPSVVYEKTAPGASVLTPIPPSCFESENEYMKHFEVCRGMSNIANGLSKRAFFFLISNLKLLASIFGDNIVLQICWKINELEGED